jgi:hypothetical protein
MTRYEVVQRHGIRGDALATPDKWFGAERFCAEFAEVNTHGDLTLSRVGETVAIFAAGDWLRCRRVEG